MYCSDIFCPVYYVRVYFVRVYFIRVYFVRSRFIVMINYGLAPTGFGRGIVVHRPITLVQIISKLFEAVIIECYGNCLVVDDLQFGMKKG